MSPAGLAKGPETLVMSWAPGVKALGCLRPGPLAVGCRPPPADAARNLSGVVAVRDSKTPSGPVLIVCRDEWASFITRLRANRLT